MKKKVNWKDLSVDAVRKMAAFYETFKGLNIGQQNMFLKILRSARN